MQTSELVAPVGVLIALLVTLIVLDRYIANHTRKKD